MQRYPQKRYSILGAAVAALALTAGLPGAAIAQDAPKKVVLRFAADFTPPPHPAGIAMKIFSERLPKAIPGSEARLYYSGSLYTIPEAFEAMRQGNLEMAWMQMGKAAPVDAWMMTVVGPGVMTTIGAVDHLEQTKTYKMLVERLAKNHAIKVFGAGQMSFGMGVGGKKRYAKPSDFTGRKFRSMGPVENPSLEAWKANPVVMAFGEVPSALESGVIDGLMTSMGGWNVVREQTPYFTTGGPGAFTGDYYMVAASLRWWNRLTPATQAALEKVILGTIQTEKELNWCVDQMTYAKYGTKDPSKPGVYWLSPAEVTTMTSAVGDATARFKKTMVPAEARPWVDTFAKEGRDLSKQHPVGSSWIEKVDCKQYASVIVIK